MQARFKLDENIPRAAIDVLLEGGHDVENVLSEGLGGHPDSEILRVASEEHRILVTFDLDFADVRFLGSSPSAAIWVLRPPTQSITNTLALLRNGSKLLETEGIRARLWIIEAGRVRIRD